MVLISRRYPFQDAHSCQNKVHDVLYTLYVIRSTLHLIRYTLYVISYTLYVIRLRFTLNVIRLRFTLYVIRYTLYVLRFTLYVYVIRYTFYVIRYTLYVLHGINQDETFIGGTKTTIILVRFPKGGSWKAKSSQNDRHTRRRKLRRPSTKCWGKKSYKNHCFVISHHFG